jgi:hypothetical protein
MTLTLIGYWLGDGAPDWPSVDSFVDTNWSTHERRAVNEWLESGVEIRQFRGYSYCRLCRARNGSSEVSDGMFLWPIGLSHYVREHHVRLPGPVVARALQRPDVDRHRLEALDGDVEVEMEWWRNQRPDWSSDSNRVS